jgi:transposase InsO family protein
VLLRFAYVAVTNAFAAVRLLPMSDRDKDAEVLVPRHQVMVLERQLGATRWADFLRSPADALPTCDFIETVTLTGRRPYILAVIEHATRRVRILGTTAHWVAQAARNLVMDLEDAGATVSYLIRDRDAKFPTIFDQILGNAGIQVMFTGVRKPRMNSLMERWVQTCCHELLDRTSILNERHLRHARGKFERHHNAHQPHQAMHQAAPLRAVPEPITDPERATRLDIRRNDRIGGVIHEYRHAA